MKMPIILNEIKFSAIGISGESFYGVVLYARTAKLLLEDTVTGHEGCHNDLDWIIEAYIKEALSQFRGVQTCFTSKAITSDNGLNDELGTYKTTDYDKRSFAFYIHHGSSTSSDVFVQKLSVCIGACSEITRKTAHSCFCNEHYHHPISEPCNCFQSLKTMVNVIENIFDYIPARRAMIEIKNDINILMQYADKILEGEQSQTVYGAPVIYQKKVKSFYLEVYKPWRQKLEALAEELNLSNISLDLFYGTIEDEYGTQYLNVPEEEQYYRMITNMKKYRDELKKTLGIVFRLTI